MPQFSLIPHPDFPCTADVRLSVLAERAGGALELVYFVAGDEAAVRWPQPSGRDRTDGLWQTTCFEAFIRVDGQPGYAELNFAPFGQWAAYSFDSYRNGRRNLEGSEEPFAEQGYKGYRGDDVYGWNCSTIDVFDPTVDWHLNLATVIEATDGTKSYWALSHAPGPPDFHNADCFIATLPAPDTP